MHKPIPDRKTECFLSSFQNLKSIVRADSKIQAARIYLSEGALPGANINRSPSSYLKNPASERRKW